MIQHVFHVVNACGHMLSKLREQPTQQRSKLLQLLHLGSVRPDRVAAIALISGPSAAFIELVPCWICLRRSPARISQSSLDLLVCDLLLSDRQPSVQVFFHIPLSALQECSVQDAVLWVLFWLMLIISRLACEESSSSPAPVPWVLVCLMVLPNRCGIEQMLPHHLPHHACPLQG